MRFSRSFPLALAALVAWVASGGAGCAEPRDERPNLILFTLDTFRADRLAAYGNPNELTPALDKFARQAVVFDHAITPIGTTHPAHSSIFTGLYSGGHGVRFNGDRLDDSFFTLAERLAESGYDTAAFVSKYSLIKSGISQGFATVSTKNPEKVKNPQFGKNNSGDWANREARQWIREDREAPVFLWLHYFDSHSPYPVTKTSEKRMRDYEGPYRHGASVGMFYAFGREVEASAENRSALEGLYDGQVVEVDRLVGAALTDLERRGVLENAVVVITADHGQLLGEHGRVGHGRKLWEPVMHVPLLIWRSGQLVSRRVEERVSLVDLFPTLLELGGLEAPDGVNGRSLVPILDGGGTAEIPYFAAVRTPKITNEVSTDHEDRRAVAVYSGRWKLVLDGDEHFLFDLQADPDELEPLQETEDGRTIVERLMPMALAHREHERPSEEPTELDPEVYEEMKALGYL